MRFSLNVDMHFVLMKQIDLYRTPFSITMTILINLSNCEILSNNQSVECASIITVLTYNVYCDPQPLMLWTVISMQAYRMGVNICIRNKVRCKHCILFQDERLTLCVCGIKDCVNYYQLFRWVDNKINNVRSTELERHYGITPTIISNTETAWACSNAIGCKRGCLMK